MNRETDRYLQRKVPLTQQNRYDEKAESIHEGKSPVISKETQSSRNTFSMNGETDPYRRQEVPGMQQNRFDWKTGTSATRESLT